MRRRAGAESTPSACSSREDGRVAVSHVLRPAHRVPRVDREDLAFNQQIEELADRGSSQLPTATLLLKAALPFGQPA
jgi:hypothetical protein